MTERDEARGRRALFEAPPIETEPVRTGKQALFSDAPPWPRAVTVECERCGARTRVPVADLARRLACLSVWNPLRTYSRRMRCPACERRAWVRVRWWE